MPDGDERRTGLWQTWHFAAAAIVLVLGLITVFEAVQSKSEWDALGAALLLGPAWGLAGMAWLLAMVASLIATKQLPPLQWILTPAIVLITFAVVAVLEAAH
jgi:hypothetical protein